MANLSNQDVQLGQQMFTSSATQQHPLGTRGYSQDGRAYRYAKAGGADLVAGSVVASPPVVALHGALTVTTTSPVNQGVTSIDVTVGTTVAANQYAEGYLGIASGLGMGFLYSVKNHGAGTSQGAVKMFFSDDESLVTTITTTAIVTLLNNKYNGVVISPASTLLGTIVGVAGYVIVSGQFGWIQTWGPALVFGGGVSALGAPLLGTATSGGRVSAVTAATLLTQRVIGYASETGVEARFYFVDLTIAP